MRLKVEAQRVLQLRLFGCRHRTWAAAIGAAVLVTGLLVACRSEHPASTPASLAVQASPTLVSPTVTRLAAAEEQPATETPAPKPTPVATDTPSPVPPTATLAATQTPEPTSTPVPPTKTPLPPTHTPAPPTNTPVPPTATPLPPSATPPPTPVPSTPTVSPPPTATPPPPPQFPWRGQVEGTFANCSLTRIMGLTLDRNGGIAGDIWVHFWADGWEGAWARSSWTVNEGYAGLDDSSNWDGVLDTRPKAGTWHACVVLGEASWDCISTTVTAQTTTEPCAPDSSGVQIVRIIFRQN